MIDKSPFAGTRDDALINKVRHDARNSVRALCELPAWIKDDLVAGGVVIPDEADHLLDLMVIHARRLDAMILDLAMFLQVGQPGDGRATDLDSALTEVLSGLEIPDGFVVVRDIECTTLPIGRQDLNVMLTALISNAVKHHHLEAGRICVTLREKGGICLLEVSDDGPGIPLAKEDYVFEAMTTLRPKDEIEGSGMGLAVVKKIVGFYGGSLVMRHDAHLVGTHFDIRFNCSAHA